METNRWIDQLNRRNDVITDYKQTNKLDYYKLKLGLTHGRGKRKRKKK